MVSGSDAKKGIPTEVVFHAGDNDVLRRLIVQRAYEHVDLPVPHEAAPVVRRLGQAGILLHDPLVGVGRHVEVTTILEDLPPCVERKGLWRDISRPPGLEGAPSFGVEGRQLQIVRDVLGELHDQVIHLVPAIMHLPAP